MRILMTLAIAFVSLLSITTARAAVPDALIRTVAEFNLPTSYESGGWRPFELSGTIIPHPLTMLFSAKKHHLSGNHQIPRSAY